MSTVRRIEERVVDEIVGLHEFFTRWMRADLTEAENEFKRFADVLDPRFTFVSTAGTLMCRDDLLAAVWRAHGKRPGLAIEILRPTLLHDNGPSCVASYEEWQTQDGERTGRQSTVIFYDIAGRALPNDLQWVHVQETRLSAENA